MVRGPFMATIGRVAIVKTGVVRTLMFAAVAVASFRLVESTHAGGGGPAGRTLTFGTAVSLSGSTASEGRLVLNGYQLWARTVDDNGGIRIGGVPYQVAIKFYDDQSNSALS